MTDLISIAKICALNILSKTGDVGMKMLCQPVGAFKGQTMKTYIFDMNNKAGDV